MSISPAFGQADLTNCERELIHLAGSVQPHGVLLVLREPQLRDRAGQANPRLRLLGRPLERLLLARLGELGGDADAGLRALGGRQRPARAAAACSAASARQRALRRRGCTASPATRWCSSSNRWTPRPRARRGVGLDSAALLQRLGAAVQRFSEASSHRHAGRRRGAVRARPDRLRPGDGLPASTPTATARSSPRRATRGWSRCSATTTRPPTSRSARASCTCATACACWSTCTTSRRRWCRGCCRAPAARRRTGHVACATCAACRRCTCST